MRRGDEVGSRGREAVGLIWGEIHLDLFSVTFICVLSSCYSRRDTARASKAHDTAVLGTAASLPAPEAPPAFGFPWPVLAVPPAPVGQLPVTSEPSLTRSASGTPATPRREWIPTARVQVARLCSRRQGALRQAREETTVELLSFHSLCLISE